MTAPANSLIHGYSMDSEGHGLVGRISLEACSVTKEHGRLTEIDHLMPCELLKPASILFLSTCINTRPYAHTQASTISYPGKIPRFA